MVIMNALSVLLLLLLATSAHADDFKLTFPLGLDEQAVRIPVENPLTQEKIALGKQFFWDTRWSRDGSLACVSCHDPDHGWSERPDRGWKDPRRPVIGTPQKTARQVPPIINRLFSDRQLWTGLRESLEDHARNDSHTSDETIVKKLGAIPAYQREFKAVFGTELNPDGVAKAIAAYVRTILSGNAPYDRFSAGEQNALSPAAKQGLVLFEGKAGCAVCHSGFNFTDERYHNIGVGMEKENPDLGRYTVTKNESDKGAFKTPTLRDVAKRGPYMHDGSLRTLKEVVAFHNKGGQKNPWLSPEMRPLGLTSQEQSDLVAFLEALSGHVAHEVATRPQLPK
jgi:cytochrome c peroxidase